MKQKASLILIEQMIMLLVFALAAAICLRAFVWANSRSAHIVATDKAVVLAQSAAEAIRNHGGDPQQALLAAAQQLQGEYRGECLQIRYDSDWNITQTGGVYCLTAAETDASVAGLGQVTVQVSEGETPLFSLTTAWQREAEADE